MKANEQYGKFTGAGEVRLVRTLPGPIERIWEYLTDPGKTRPLVRRRCARAKAAGGRVGFAMSQADFAPDETPPDKYKACASHGRDHRGPRAPMRTTPRLLAFTFGGDDSEVTFELSKPRAARCCW